MNTAKIIGICNRIRITRPAKRQPLVSELLDAIDEGENPGLMPGKKQVTTGALDVLRGVTGKLDNLRDMLEWPEVKANPSMVAKIARILRAQREAA
jgi:hypothetical protein